MDPELLIWNVFLEKKQVYFSEFTSFTKLSHSSLQNVLTKLVEKNYLHKEKTKAHVFYTIKNKEYAALQFSILANKKFSSLPRSIRIPLDNFLRDLPSNIFSVILFGSASRGSEKKGSDIDLLVIYEGNQDLLKISQKNSEISKYPLSIFKYSVNDFIKNLDPLVIQAKKTGFPVKGAQFFYEATFNEYREVL
ncbi:MAG: nucleotidyltransferase domain-containing protein [Candidatus Woesearchaeota archaeon]